MGAALPGATTAFKPKAAPATGVAPQQVGNVKFPGKVNTKVSHLLPEIKVAGAGNALLGAALAALAGRLAGIIPGLKNVLGPDSIARDAAIGATVATVLEHVNKPDEEDKPDVYNPRAADPSHLGWRLM